MKINIWILILTLTFVGCGNNTTDYEYVFESEIAQPSLPEGFDEFYVQFHADTVFQLEHITFPLEGLPSSMDSTVTVQGLRNFKWQKEDWKLHKNFNQDAQFERTFSVISPTLVQEESTHKMLGIKMVRRFAKTGSGWQLIYYSAP